MKADSTELRPRANVLVDDVSIKSGNVGRDCNAHYDWVDVAPRPSDGDIAEMAEGVVITTTQQRSMVRGRGVSGYVDPRLPRA